MWTTIYKICKHVETLFDIEANNYSKKLQY